jgi:hypothetical protein
MVEDLMEIDPLVSIVMPVYNGEKYLAKAIESILIQSFTNFEFIIIDDGSNDSSLTILKQYSSKDPRVRVIVNEENLGIAKSLNKGVTQAQGKYIARMDADDISLSNRIEQQVDFLEAHPDISVLGAQFTIIDSNDNLLGGITLPIFPGVVKWELIYSCPLAHPAIMMRRSLFSIEGFQYRHRPVAQDYDLWSRISRNHKLTNLPETLLLLRKHHGNISKTNELQQLHETSGIIKENITFYTGQDVSERVVLGIFASLKNIETTQDAKDCSEMMILLQRQTNNWDITKQERVAIRKIVATKLRTIWHVNHHNIRLLPYVLYSAVLDPQALVNRVFKTTIIT